MPGEGSNLRPTIQTPEGFLAECHKRGIKLTAINGAIKATGKPPANPEKFAAFLRSQKPDLLALLSPSREAESSELRQVKAPFVAGEPTLPNDAEKYRESTVKTQPILPELVEVGKESPSELRQVATKFAPRLEHIETVSRGEFEQVGTVLPSTELYQDKRQEVLTWALQEAKKGTLPEPMRGAGRSSELAEALTLPSGQVVPAAGASAWLIAGHDRALRLGLQPYPDCEAALMILRHDLRALSLWAAHAYEHSTPHEGDDTP